MDTSLWLFQRIPSATRDTAPARGGVLQRRPHPAGASERGAKNRPPHCAQQPLLLSQGKKQIHHSGSLVHTPGFIYHKNTVNLQS